MPLWAYIDLFTIADISILYSISLKEVQKNIANNFKLYANKAPQILKKFMHSMTIIRNLCAHGCRIYDRIFHQKPSLNKKEKSLLIQNNNGELDNTHFYGFLMIMKKLLSELDFQSIKSNIIELTKKYPIKMIYYGFREDWIEKL